MEDEDFALALKLYEEWNQKDSSSNVTKTSKTEREKDLSIVDPSWELIDPVPDIRELFVQFNAAYFDGILAGVEVKWSTRMTLCAGLCCYEGRGGLCSIKLSQPLLKLRPRKDLVETLLHEMIHALLFVTNNNKDHDGHGPEFHKHMYRINNRTGTNITVYHSFHDEVNEYRQHWWRCDGPCVKRPPYFGIVRRAMNRAPSPRDTWWNDHQRKCGGKFTKIKEPEKPAKKGGKTKSTGTEHDGNSKSKPNIDEKKAITNWFSKNKENKDLGTGEKVPPSMTSLNKGSSTITSLSSKHVSKSENEVYQSSSANSSSNIYGFKMSANNKPQTVPIASFSGEGRKLGEPKAEGKSNFLAKIEENMKIKREKIDTSNKSNKIVNTKNRINTKSSKDNVNSSKQSIKNSNSAAQTSKGSRERSNYFSTNTPKVDNCFSQKANNGVKIANQTDISSVHLNTTKSKKNDLNSKFDSNKRFMRTSDSDDNTTTPSKKQKAIVHIIDDDIDDEVPFVSKCLVDCPACPAKVPEHELNAHLDICLQ